IVPGNIEMKATTAASIQLPSIAQTTAIAIPIPNAATWMVRWRIARICHRRQGESVLTGAVSPWRAVKHSQGGAQARRMSAANPAARARGRLMRGSGGRDGLELESGHVPEDIVVGNERDPKTDRCGGYPSVGVVFLLAQAMSNPPTVDAELGVGDDELGAGVYGCRHRDLGLQLEHPRRSPPAQERPEAKLCCRLKRDKRRPPHNERFVEFSKARSGNQVRPENVGVNDDGAADWLSRHACSAARNSAPSSGVRSSITISACEGKGLALASNTSTGSSRLPSPEGWGCGFDISRRSVDERRRGSPPTRMAHAVPPRRSWTCPRVPHSCKCRWRRSNWREQRGRHAWTLSPTCERHWDAKWITRIFSDLALDKRS